MYEHRTQPLLDRRTFFRRLARTSTLGTVLILVSLAVGMAGFHLIEHLRWIDAFINAAMLLSGMGPLDAPQSDAGKLFAGLYALYCGLAVLVAAGVMFAPLIHRSFHRFHVDEAARAAR